MESPAKLIAGAMVTLAVATASLVVLPYLQIRQVTAPEGLQPYGEAALRGRQQYIAHGCVYCHSQQPRAPAQAPDAQRGWGRASVAADYVYDQPHLLGTMRTGPDLFNIGARQPSEDWHLGHLYQPRAYVEDSSMPSYPFLFEVKAEAASSDRVVRLPTGFGPARGVLVARPEARDLVAYLQSLDHTYPAPDPDAGAGTPLSQDPP